MVALSVEEGMPVMIVSLHYRPVLSFERLTPMPIARYRLNWFGFLASTDLLDEARDNGNGFTANLGPLDQRLGFQRVLQHIAGFGGDPTNITAFGESGRSISLVHHLCAPKPLFHRAILQSGIVGSPSEDYAPYHALYEKLLGYLNIDEPSPERRLTALRAAPVDRLVQAVIDLKVAPMWPYASDSDPFYSASPPRWSTTERQFGNCTWCKDIILGDSSFEDFMLVNGLLHSGRQNEFMTALSSTLQPADDEQLRSYYNIDPSLPSDLFWTNAAPLLGDMAFSEPTDKLACGLSTFPNGKSYRYTLALSNPLSR